MESRHLEILIAADFFLRALKAGVFIFAKFIFIWALRLIRQDNNPSDVPTRRRIEDIVAQVRICISEPQGLSRSSKFIHTTIVCNIR